MRIVRTQAPRMWICARLSHSGREHRDAGTTGSTQAASGTTFHTWLAPGTVSLILFAMALTRIRCGVGRSRGRCLWRDLHRQLAGLDGRRRTHGAAHHGLHRSRCLPHWRSDHPVRRAVVGSIDSASVATAQGQEALLPGCERHKESQPLLNRITNRAEARSRSSSARVVALGSSKLQ